MVNKVRKSRQAAGILVGLLLIGLGTAFGLPQAFQDKDIAKKLQGFDATMEKILKDWNAPGVGVGIVVGDRLVFAKGYGYRDYGKKLPFTPKTMFSIASNTKLFTAVAAGMVVEDGKLNWDRPVRESVPEIRFFNDELNNTVTLHDMLSHRTGISRHDTIWWKSDLTRKEFFDRLRYLEPQIPLRQAALYNNLMYAAVGYLIELKTGKTWEEFVREKILTPLGMNSTVLSVPDMLKQPEVVIPYSEKLGSTELSPVAVYQDGGGLGPAGAVSSTIEDMSHWLIALMNGGKFDGRQVLPESVLKATMEPSIAYPNLGFTMKGFQENLNINYGMGRMISVYRGHLYTSHGGALPGCYSQVSFMPSERIGVIVFVIGDHCSSLYDVINFNIYERLLGLNQTPWSERWLDIIGTMKKERLAHQGKVLEGRVPGTSPSHPLADFTGDYEHLAYGVIKIGLNEGRLQFDFHKIRIPLDHFHYDRFDTANDEMGRKWTVSFQTNPQGDVDKAVMPLDEVEAVFVRKPEKLDPAKLQELVGTYAMDSGMKLQVSLKDGNTLILSSLFQKGSVLLPTRGLKFRIQAFSDVVYEFLAENGRISGLKEKDRNGESVYKKQ